MKKNKKILMGLGTIGIALAPIVGAISCGAGSDSDIGFVNYSGADTFMKTVESGIKDHASKLGTSVKTADAMNDQNVENTNIESQINSGVKGLLINLVEPASGSIVVNKAKEAKLPIVLVNKEVDIATRKTVMESYDKIAYVGSDPKESGDFQALQIYNDLVSGLIKDRGTQDGKIDYVILGGQAGHADALARTAAIKIKLTELITAKGINPTPSQSAGSITVGSKKEFHVGVGSFTWSDIFSTHAADKSLDWSLVGSVSGASDWSVEGGKGVVKGIETGGSTLDFVAGNNDDTALGAVQYYFVDIADSANGGKPLTTAAKEIAYIASTKTTYMPIYGIDANQSALTSIKAGKLAGTVKQDGKSIGAVSLQAIYNLINGKAVNDGFDKIVLGIVEDKTNGGKAYRIPYVSLTRKEVRDK